MSIVTEGVKQMKSRPEPSVDFADSQRYPYEGTRQMQSLIVGKAIAGFSACI